MRIKIIALLSAAVMLTGICASARYSSDDLPKRLDDAVTWSESNFPPDLNPQFESSSYQIMAMARMGKDYDYSSYLSGIESVAAGYNEYTPASAYAKLALAVSAAGGDPQNVGGRNLLSEGIYNRSETSPLDLNSTTDMSWALIALDSKRYSVPSEAAAPREGVVSALALTQRDDGGFGANAYDTALAVCALSNYADGGWVSADSINAAVNYLSSVQGAHGDYGSPDTTAMVLIALDAIGVDSDNDTRFVKNNNNVMDGLLSYAVSDGSFSRSDETTGLAECAVASHIRYLDGNSKFFEFASADIPHSVTEYERNKNSDQNDDENDNTNTNTSNNTNNNTSTNTNTNTNTNTSSSNNSGTSTNTNSNNSQSVSSSSTTTPRITPIPRPAVTPRPTVMPRVTIAPRATTGARITPMPRASASPRPVRTPRPTVEPELVGPVKLPGPMPTPEPTIEPDYMTGDLTRDDILSKDTISIPTAVGIIGLMALGGLVIAFMANRIPKVIEKKRTRKKQSDIYRAKIHRRTEIHGAYKAREKYKERRKYRGSYRK